MNIVVSDKVRSSSPLIESALRLNGHNAVHAVCDGIFVNFDARRTIKNNATAPPRTGPAGSESVILHNIVSDNGIEAYLVENPCHLISRCVVSLVQGTFI